MRFSLMSYILPICHSVFSHQSNMFWEIESRSMAEYEANGWRTEEEENGSMRRLDVFTQWLFVTQLSGVCVRARLPFIAILHSPYFHNINKNRLVEK